MMESENNDSLSTSDSTIPETDRFKESFKYFRSIENCKGSKEVFFKLDSDSISDDALNFINEHTEPILPKLPNSNNYPNLSSWGLKPLNQWKIYGFKFPQGLIYLRNPFTSEGQRYWIARSLLDFPSKPHITNIENLINRKRNSQGEIKVISPSDPDYYKKLRWVTFGYHHNWDTKVYSESEKCDFPKDLESLTKYFAEVLGFENYSPEAAIINYYILDSTLSGHRDYSEPNQEAPLFSLSFGQTALFLIGGPSKSIKPTAMYLSSGDLVVMSGKSRLSYHAVPRILKANQYPWLEDTNDDGTEANSELSKWSKFCVEYISTNRINMNIRQVLHLGQESL